jgi:hypothetical protein
VISVPLFALDCVLVQNTVALMRPFQTGLPFSSSNQLFAALAVILTIQWLGLMVDGLVRVVSLILYLYSLRHEIHRAGQTTLVGYLYAVVHEHTISTLYKYSQMSRFYSKPVKREPLVAKRYSVPSLSPLPPPARTCSPLILEPTF